MHKNTVIFDLDGTLADTAPDLIGTLNRIIAPYEVPQVDLKQVGQIVGHGAKAMIRKAFEIGGKDLQPELQEALFADFLEDYSANIANETRLFDGLLDAMGILKEDGFTFCVCTNKMESLARILVSELGVSDHFSALTGGDTFAFKKPDPRHLEETVRLMGREIGSAIMVGDSSTDINAAINAGIPSIAVTFGYSDQPPNSLGATRIISHYSELHQTIMDISKKDQAAAT
ncbi:MAG: HAD hydrolase-like protein [Pseudomonadota bacterium]